MWNRIRAFLKEYRVYVGLGIAGIGIALLVFDIPGKFGPQKELYSRFVAEIDRNEVRSVVVEPRGMLNEIHVIPKIGQPYVVTGSLMDSTALAQLANSGATVRVEEPSSGFISGVFRIIEILLPILLLGFMMKMLPGMKRTGGRDAEKSTKTFADVAGATEAKNALMELVAYLKDPSAYAKLGARFPSGYLLHGSPGTGKTLLAQAVAGEAGVPFLARSASDFGSPFIGVAGGEIRSLFKEARKKAPCIVFIDEIDAIGGERLGEASVGAREQNAILNALLVEMDGFSKNAGVVVIAATNRLESLDQAFVRAGRFDRRLNVPNPTLLERVDCLRIASAGITLDPKFDFPTLARECIGLSPADLHNVMNQAAVIAVRDKATQVTMEHAYQARRMLAMGEENTGLYNALWARHRRPRDRP